MATYMGKMILEGETLLVGSTLYGVCETPAATNDKTAPIAGFDTLMTGVTIHIKFAEGNTGARPTLDVNETGPWPIRVDDETYGIQSASAGSVYSLTFDGSTWVVNS